MDKFTTNQFAEETTAADIYAMREEFRQEEQELAEIADAQWQAFQDDHEAEEPLPTFDPHRDFYAEMDDEAYEWTEEAIAWEEGMHPDELYDYNELDEHDLRVAQAEWEAEMHLENDLYMVYDDPDYWD